MLASTSVCTVPVSRVSAGRGAPGPAAAMGFSSPQRDLLRSRGCFSNTTCTVAKTHGVAGRSPSQQRTGGTERNRGWQHTVTRGLIRQLGSPAEQGWWLGRMPALVEPSPRGPCTGGPPLAAPCAGVHGPGGPWKTPAPGDLAPRGAGQPPPPAEPPDSAGRGGSCPHLRCPRWRC